MKNKESTRYLLVMEKRPNDYMPIIFNLLDISTKNYSDLKSIDIFTKAFSKEEILASVKRANIVPEDYFSGKMCIIEVIDGSMKYIHKYPVLTSDILNDFDIVSFIYANIKNKDILNKIFNVYLKLNGDDKAACDDFKRSISEGYVREILRGILSLPYSKYRELIYYIIDKLYIKEKENELLLKKG